jgi:transposase
LLSNAGKNIRTLAAYFSLDPDTIHNWIKRWETPLPDEKSPLERLKDAFRSGRPSLLPPEKKKYRAIPADFFALNSHLFSHLSPTI